MRVMVLVKATKDSETGLMPSTELLAAMGRYNEKLVDAGILLAGEGLHPSSRGKRVAFDGDSRTVVDGPFATAGDPRLLAARLNPPHAAKAMQSHIMCPDRL